MNGPLSVFDWSIHPIFIHVTAFQSAVCLITTARLQSHRHLNWEFYWEHPPSSTQDPTDLWETVQNGLRNSPVGRLAYANESRGTVGIQRLEILPTLTRFKWYSSYGITCLYWEHRRTSSGVFWKDWACLTPISSRTGVQCSSLSMESALNVKCEWGLMQQISTNLASKQIEHYLRQFLWVCRIELGDPPSHIFIDSIGTSLSTFYPL